MAGGAARRPYDAGFPVKKLSSTGLSLPSIACVGEPA